MSSKIKLVPASDPVLRQRATVIPEVLQANAVSLEMIEICKRFNGIGLAAPQVGLPWRLIVVALAPKQLPRQWCVLLDPVVKRTLGEKDIDYEGCLSMPGRKVWVWRHRVIELDATCLRYGPETFHWSPLRRSTLKFEGLAARCVQHELDHLEGVLIDKYESGRHDDMASAWSAM